MALAHVAGYSKDGLRVWVIPDGHTTRKAVSRQFVRLWKTTGDDER